MATPWAPPASRVTRIKAPPPVTARPGEAGEINKSLSQLALVVQRLTASGSSVLGRD